MRNDAHLDPAPQQTPPAAPRGCRVQQAGFTPKPSTLQAWIPPSPPGLCPSPAPLKPGFPPALVEEHPGGTRVVPGDPPRPLPGRGSLLPC